MSAGGARRVAVVHDGDKVLACLQSYVMQTSVPFDLGAYNSLQTGQAASGSGLLTSAPFLRLWLFSFPDAQVFSVLKWACLITHHSLTLCFMSGWISSLKLAGYDGPKLCLELLSYLDGILVPNLLVLMDPTAKIALMSGWISILLAKLLVMPLKTLNMMDLTSNCPKVSQKKFVGSLELCITSGYLARFPPTSGYWSKCNILDSKSRLWWCEVQYTKVVTLLNHVRRLRKSDVKRKQALRSLGNEGRLEIEKLLDKVQLLEPSLPKQNNVGSQSATFEPTLS